MKYKNLYYNVEPIAYRLPDDCLHLIIQFAWCDKKYERIKCVNRNIHHTSSKDFYCLSTYNYPKVGFIYELWIDDEQFTFECWIKRKRRNKDFEHEYILKYKYVYNIFEQVLNN